MKHNARRERQGGAVIVTVALLLLFLLGFMGIALDFGRLFIVKTELQTAMDSCALAAAQELDGTGTAIARAQSAGMTAGNLNKVNLQSATWSGKGQLINADITFRDQAYVDTTGAAAARYAECKHVQPEVQLWLLHVLGAAIGNSSDYPNTMDVGALAVATRGSAQTTCPVPIALRRKGTGTAPNWGYVRGEWVTLLVVSDKGQGGHIGWANLDGSNSAANTVAQLNNYCGVAVNQPLGTPGVQSTIADNWNWRFGIYKNSQSPDQQFQNPDMTGYAFTKSNWPSETNAYDGPKPAGAHASAENFVTKRASYANCANTSTTAQVKACEDIIDRNVPGKDAVPGGAAATGGHRQYGANRRIVTVPVTDGYPGKVVDYVCMLILQPLSIPKADIQLEFIGNASEASSPCTTSGVPGGASGPLVPVLVR